VKAVAVPVVETGPAVAARGTFAAADTLAAADTFAAADTREARVSQKPLFAPPKSYVHVSKNGFLFRAPGSVESSKPLGAWLSRWRLMDGFPRNRTPTSGSALGYVDVALWRVEGGFS
jgi:hypothetical protein